jgi:hypothetical protein
MKYPLSRAVIAEIETATKPRSRRVTLNDAVAMSAALGVAFVHMVVPIDDEEGVELTPDLRVSAPTARRWFRGERALGDPHVYESQRPASEQDFSLAPALTELRNLVADLIATYPRGSFDDDEAEVVAQNIAMSRQLVEIIGVKTEGIRLDLIRKQQQHHERTRKGLDLPDVRVAMTTPKERDGVD